MERILVFIPVYNCQHQIQRVLAKFDAHVLPFFAEILIVDNQSQDGTLRACQQAIQHLPNVNITLVQNIENYNLGGSHKVAFNYAIEHHFDYIIVLHGDDQGDIRDVVPYLQKKMHHTTDCLLGGRFMKHSTLVNYSWFRTVGNRCFNLLFSLICRRKLYDLGAGLNVYKVSFLQNKFYINFPNALTFNYYMLLYTVATGAGFQFFPVTWREEDQISNVKLFKQTRQLCVLLTKFIFSRTTLLFTPQEKAYAYASQPVHSMHAENEPA